MKCRILIFNNILGFWSRVLVGRLSIRMIEDTEIIKKYRKSKVLGILAKVKTVYF
jgi:hypothetical protein